MSTEIQRPAAPFKLRALLYWLPFAFGVLTIIYPRFTGQPLVPVYDYGVLENYSFWQVPFVYVASYVTRAWGALLFAFTLGGICIAFLPREKMKKYMSSGNAAAYVLAAALAPVLTVCSCAMIPIFGGLLVTGVGIGPAITFLLMAPAANILALIFTWELLSVKIMIARLIFSFLGLFL
ncbi:MAG: permease [Spirochaetia bacterium]|nr:permease [Spirochaetia bacterium]